MSDCRGALSGHVVDFSDIQGSPAANSALSAAMDRIKSQ